MSSPVILNIDCWRVPTSHIQNERIWLPSENFAPIVWLKEEMRGRAGRRGSTM